MKRYWVFILFVFFAGEVFAQDKVVLSDQKYGFDPVLFNGKKYSFFPASIIKGHQYLEQPDFTPGELILKGKVYRNVLLNFDIYNQLLLMKYYDDLNAACIIEISNAWLDGFTISGRRFVAITNSNKTSLYEVIGNDWLHVLYSWSKQIKIEPATSNQAFTKAFRSSFIQINGKMIIYRSKKQFLSSFDQDTRALIQRFLHSRHIRFNQINNQQMEELINEIVKSKKL